jgi:hypothetical protein
MFLSPRVDRVALGGHVGAGADPPPPAKKEPIGGTKIGPRRTSPPTFLASDALGGRRLYAALAGHSSRRPRQGKRRPGVATPLSKRKAIRTAVDQPKRLAREQMRRDGERAPEFPASAESAAGWREGRARPVRHAGRSAVETKPVGPNGAGSANFVQSPSSRPNTIATVALWLR